MQDIIQLLPDHLANQIAAGEVIQRPASAVKELLENAIDAGATDIQLIIKDAGKELIQVVDNGSGMSPMDARMSFERHATSKIKQIDDLFAIKTMGFRGEALASVAAVAQVELKTKSKDDEIGTQIIIEASEVKSQTPIAFNTGTSFSIKNLFYNVPARRKFLKSNTAEFRHIVDEFSRVAMAYPEISFRLFHNNTEQFHLNAGNLKSRIINLLGNKSEKVLIPISEILDTVKITGFIGKPEAASRSRGNQFFFVNKRFIRSPYLNHAAMGAFEGLIDKESFPFFVLFLELAPESVDVNVHPSKQEVKFDDESMLYAYLQATIKHALARFNIAPSLDFTLNPEIQNLESMRLPANDAQIEAMQTGYLQHSFSEKGKAHFIPNRQERQDWDVQKRAIFPEFPPTLSLSNQSASAPTQVSQELFSGEGYSQQQTILNWNGYIMTTVKSGILLLHQKRALERIIFERMERRISAHKTFSQQLLFPIALSVAPMDIHLLEAALPFLKKVGFDIAAFGPKDFVIQGTPPDLPEGKAEQVIEQVLEQLKMDSSILKDPLHNRLLIMLSKKIALQSMHASNQDNRSLIDELFACKSPQFAPDGKSIFLILSKEHLDNLI